MRLGVIGLIPSDFFAADDGLMEHIRGMGFTGVAAHISGNPQEVNPAALQHLVRLLERHQIRFVQLWGWYPSIVTTDQSVRDSGIAAANTIIRLGAEFGAEMIGLRPTSMSPHGPWSPDGRNYHADTRARLIDSLTQIGQTCEIYQMHVGLECHCLTALSTPSITRQVLEAVGSPWLKINFDPINFLTDLPTAYNSAALINEMFDELGHYAVTAHIKDAAVDDNLVVHISEVPLGEGIFDLDTFLLRYQALHPDKFAFIEHLPPEKIPAAATFLRQKLHTLNIPILE